MNINPDEPTQEITAGANAANDSALDLTIAGGSQTTKSTKQSPSDQSLKPGSDFGDYVLESEIARGGMGVVYRARQKSLNRVVALKMILSGRLASASDIKRFYVEAEAAASLDHPNIVPIYDIGQVGSHHYFSMGYVEGESLDRWLSDRPLEFSTVARIVRTLADAIQYAHEKGIVHRDLKPANLLMGKPSHSSGITSGLPGTASGASLTSASQSKSSTRLTGSNLKSNLNEDWSIKITDFGLAKQMEGESELTNTGQILGTPSYMAPEQAAGRIADIGYRTDIYSMGAILYRLLVGRPPFQAGSALDTVMQVINQEPVAPRKLTPSIPLDLETICLKCLEKNPDLRYQTASELALDLERWSRGEPIAARPISRIEKAYRWARRHPAATFAGVLSLASLIAVVSILSLSNRKLTLQRNLAVQAQLETDQQRQSAQQRLQEASEMLTRLIKRASSQRWATQPDFQDERQAVLEEAANFYATLVASPELLTSTGDEKRVQWELALAHRQLALARFSISDTENAIASLKTAIEQIDQLIARSEDNANYQWKKSQFLQTLETMEGFSMNARVSRGNKNELAERALENAQSAFQAKPEDDRFQDQYLASLSHYLRSPELLKPEQRSDLFSKLEKHLASIENRAEKSTQSLKAIVHARVALAYEAAEKLEYLKALEKFKTSLELLEQVQDAQELDADEFAQLMFMKGLMLIRIGSYFPQEAATPADQVEKNLEAFAQGVNILEDVVKWHPSAAHYQYQLYQSYQYQARLLSGLKREEEANVAKQKERDIFQSMREKFGHQAWIQAQGSIFDSIELMERIRKGRVEGLEAEVEKQIAACPEVARWQILYNLACVYSQASVHESGARQNELIGLALSKLEEMDKLGFFKSKKVLESALKDPDLQLIRDSEAGKPFFQKLNENQSAPPPDQNQ